MLYKYIIRNNNICYIHARGDRRLPQVLLTKDGKIVSIKHAFTKKNVIAYNDEICITHPLTNLDIFLEMVFCYRAIVTLDEILCSLY